MELAISHSSLRPSAVLPQRCKSSSHDNRMICIKPTTKNINNCSSNFPSKLCSTNRLIQPLAGLYGESKQDRPRNIIRVCICMCVCAWMLQFALHKKTKKNFSLKIYAYLISRCGFVNFFSCPNWFSITCQVKQMVLGMWSGRTR